MNWMEVVLLIVGAGIFIVSFALPKRSDNDEEVQQIDEEIIRNLIEKELAEAKGRVTEVVDETLEYAVEKTERASERISNEKIMTISEYSDTVLSDINKAHQEVMFLYDMLNDKHNNLKETVKHVDKTAKEAEAAANAAAIALSAKAAEEAKTREAQEFALKEADEKNAAIERAEKEKAAREKEYARKQMARLILPMQQELSTHHQIESNAMIPAYAINPGVQSMQSRAISMQKSIDNASELKPLVVKSVEILPADVVLSSNMQPVSEGTNVSPVSAVDLQTLGTRPEDLKVVDVKPAEIRPVEVYSFAEQAPRVERPVKKAIENAMSMIKPSKSSTENAVSEKTKENNNDRILRLHEEGLSNVDIAKKLGLGVGEVKLVINLFKGAV